MSLQSANHRHQSGLLKTHVLMMRGGTPCASALGGELGNLLGGHHLTLTHQHIDITN